VKWLIALISVAPLAAGRSFRQNWKQKGSVFHISSRLRKGPVATLGVETASGSDAIRRAEFENYVAASAIKLALIGTGSVRLSDEIKKRLLTTFLTLMILRENLDRTPSPFLSRQPSYQDRSVHGLSRCACLIEHQVPALVSMRGYESP